MPIVANIRVLMADTDAMGIVYHANYLRWFEVGRAELVRAAGLPYVEMEKMGLALPVIEARLRYKASARYDDVLTIDTRVLEFGRVRVNFHYRVAREGDETLLCEGETFHACIDRAGKIARFPERVRAALEVAQARSELTPG